MTERMPVGTEGLRNKAMKAWELGGFGRENLRMVEKDVRAPGNNEVLVKVSAVSLNARDKLLVEGAYNPDLAFPMVQGSDAVGVVVETGKNVTRVKHGDRVLTNFATRWLEGPPQSEESKYTLGNLISGALAEQIVIDEEIAVHAPAYLTDIEAATLPCAAVTAWYAVAEKAKIYAGQYAGQNAGQHAGQNAGQYAGQTVLVQGTGGVSLFALQIAAALGTEVIVTSSSDEKIERAKQMGAAHGINYVRQPDWEQAVLSLTAGKGADLIVEVAGGENLRRSLQAAKIGGHIALIGFLDGVTSEIPLFPFVVKQLTVSGSSVGPRAAFEEMLRSFEKWQLHPVIDTVYSFQDTLAAYDHLYRGAFGKIVISLNRD
jgi:NADPH:quinone reductase-like Zn-dependent oxidoreductase